MREGLARILSATEFRIVASQPRLDDHLLCSLPQDQKLLLIIDVSDDFEVALEQIDYFKRHSPTARIVVLGHCDQPNKMTLAFRAGANAYLSNVKTYRTFIKCLELVVLNMTLLPPEVLAFISDQYDRAQAEEFVNYEEAPSERLRHDRLDGNLAPNLETDESTSPAESSPTQRLSDRQEAILRCLIQGDSNKTIARKMDMAEATVKAHVKAVLRRIRAHNRTQAAVWAMSHCSVAEHDGPSIAKNSSEQSRSMEHANDQCRDRRANLRAKRRYDD